MLPLVAALLKVGLPILGNAVLNKGQEFVEEKLGVKLPEPDTLFANPALVEQLKALEVAREQQLREFALENRRLDIDEFKAELADRESARSREVKIAETRPKETPWYIPPFQHMLSLIVVIGGGWMLVMAADTDIRLVAASSITLVLGYYYGTSKNSKEKDSTISTLVGAKNESSQ